LTLRNTNTPPEITAPIIILCNAAHNTSSFHDALAVDSGRCRSLPDIPGWTCLPLCPDTAGSRRDDTVNNTFLLARRDEDDHVTPPQLFDTAGSEMNLVTRPEQRAYAVTSTKDLAATWMFQPPRCEFFRQVHLGTSSIFSLDSPIRLSRRSRLGRSCFRDSGKRPSLSASSQNQKGAQKSRLL
jgi:hypothetical protein